MFRKRNDWQPEDVLASQLAMNGNTWQALQANGVDEQTQVRLDFFCDAPESSAADQLAAFLQAETDYEVKAEKRAVAGSTQPTAISKEILDQWVEWMVVAGHENGRCKFDGWGAAVPKTA
jgi:hypothetical protein